jgi:CelD/BcsL family acetyltransferase involved in cellulose biosynthesis
LDIEIVRPRALSAELVQRWRTIQAADPALDSPFLSPNWARTVERVQPGVDPGLRVAVLRDGETARGFMAVRAGAFTAMAPGAPMCDYQGLVAEPGVTLDPRRLVAALEVGRFDFSHMLADQPSFQRYLRGTDRSFVVELPSGYEAYAAGRKAAGVGALKDLDKKRRKVERELGPITFTADSRSGLEFEQLLSWKRAQLKATSQTDLFATPWTVALLRDLFESRDPEFGATLFTLRIGERLAAVHLHLRGLKVIHAWMIAHDCELERYSPGLLLFQDILRWMDGSPYERLDLGPGDYRFKRELANAERRIGHGFVGVPSPAALVRSAAYGVRAAAEALPLGAVSALPGKAMRRMDIVRGLR